MEGEVPPEIAQENASSNIVIETSDLAEHSEFERTIDLAKEMALAKLPQAQTLPEFMMLTNAARGLNAHELASWVEEEFRHRSAEEWLQDNLEERDRQKFRQEAERVAALRALATSTPITDSVRVALMKVEEAGPFENRIAYRALAVFPQGRQVESYDVSRVSQSAQDEVYIDFSAPCNEQAASTVLGENQTGVFEVEDATLADLSKKLGFDISLGTKQNFKYRDAEGKTIGTRDPKLYVLFALKGGYSNEKDRYLVSDFSPKPVDESSEQKSK